MDKKQALTYILTLLKTAKADPKAFAELEKAKIDMGLNISQKRVQRASRGNDKAFGGRPEWSSGDPRNDRVEGVHTHPTDSFSPPSVKRTLRNLMTLKQMPKPQLTKSEDSMNKSVLDIAKELLKAHKEDPKAFEQLTKGMAAPAMAPKPSAPKAPPAAPKTAAPKAPAMKAPAAAPKAPMMKEENCGPKMMSKEEIQADIKKEWKPKFKKG